MDGQVRGMLLLRGREGLEKIVDQCNDHAKDQMTDQPTDESHHATVICHP